MVGLLKASDLLVVGGVLLTVGGGGTALFVTVGGDETALGDSSELSAIFFLAINFLFKADIISSIGFAAGGGRLSSVISDLFFSVTPCNALANAPPEGGGGGAGGPPPLGGGGGGGGGGGPLPGGGGAGGPAGGGAGVDGGA